MSQKCEGNCGLWVLHEIVDKTYAENMKKIVDAIWELPAKQHSQSSQFPLKLGWTGYFFSHLHDNSVSFFRNETIETHFQIFLMVIILPIARA